MKKEQFDMGMIGLGVMGLNLARNIADHGYSVVGYDIDLAKVKSAGEATAKRLHFTANLDDFIASLKQPRNIMMLIPAGSPVDRVIQELVPHLKPGDLVIDGGNSYYKDTALRAKTLSQLGINFFGIGVSGGEAGAREGPSMMPGGPVEVYPRIAPILEAAAAKVQGIPCVAYLGPGAAGHFVKMVHNGIEYGIMQLISETYDLMKRGLGFNDDLLSDTYASWNQGELESYLLEISTHIFKKGDQSTGKRVIDEILDVARQKGTGMWATQSAMELQIPTPTIDMAVNMRHLSMQEELRRQASKILHRPIRPFQGERDEWLKIFANAFYVASLITYAQGFALLREASIELHYGLNLETIASIWRGGCIIRAALLNDIKYAYSTNHALPHLLLDPEIAQKIQMEENALRNLIASSTDSGIPLPGFMSALFYLDGCRSAWLPANLIQAQRDYFGAHTYERIDTKGTFHTDWEEE